MRLPYGYKIGRFAKGVALLFLAFHLMFTSYVQIHYLSTLDFEQPAIDAISLWYNLMIIPITVFAAWGFWALVGPELLNYILAKTNEVD